MKIFNTKISSILGQLFISATLLTLIIFANSCANTGVGPSGGLKDSIPPVVINSIPQPYEVNYKRKEIQITFEEYVVVNNLSTKLTVSPPLAEKPTIKTKGKSIIIKINEDLIPDRTYSVDFKDGIKDYNEGNTIENYRLSFSTSDKIDTLQISGYLMDAFNHEPVENAMVTLYSINEDSLFTTLVPDFIATCDEDGYFLFDNLPADDYFFHGLVDIDNNLYFTMETEQIAFTDSLITPSAQFSSKIDTIINGTDTLITKGGTEFSPGPFTCYLFTQNYFSQYLETYKRESADKMMIYFNESLSDSFNIELTGHDKTKEWCYTEYSTNRDSVNIWITDTLLSQTDTLYLKTTYTITDSTNSFISKIDTLDMIFTPKKAKGKSKKKAIKIKKVESFKITSNLKSTNFDLNTPILIESTIPFKEIKAESIHLEKAINDSTLEKVNYKLDPIPDSKRKYKITFNAEEETNYLFSIDSASTTSLTGLSNLGVETRFKTQSDDYYGIAIFTIEGIDTTALVQLLKNSEEEEVIKEIKVEKETTDVTFNYLKPNKYRLKVVFDANNNGKWDTGNLEKKIQAESVYYFPKIFKIRSNWDHKESWTIDRNKVAPKELIDPNKDKEKNKKSGRK